jgi:hypothetical protein
MMMWIGFEKEGVYEGTSTLFIGSPNVTFEDIKEAKQYQKFEQVYFGAGVCSKINYNVVKQTRQAFAKMIITLEMDYKEFTNVKEEMLGYDINYILTVTHKSFSKLQYKPKSTIQIKIQSLEGNDKFLAIAVLQDFQIVDLSELNKKTYKGDKVLK